MNGSRMLTADERIEDHPECQTLDAGIASRGYQVAGPSKVASIESPRLLSEEQTLEVGQHRVLVADPRTTVIYHRLERLAGTLLSVLLRGETGTGKELAATAIHAWSKRADRPFVAINCAALPENLAESELFGYERGAFSGADRAKPGLLEGARGGTVFLDEVGDLPLAVQAKLLRALETRRVVRLGSVQERAVDFRLISATGRPLHQGIKAGWFREDLYYRIGAAVVHLPPLRERRRELRLLVRRFLDEGCRALGRPHVAITGAAMSRLLAYPWPGNIRELKNVMEYLAATGTGAEIGPEEVLQDRDDGAATSPLWKQVVAPLPLQPLVDASREFERRSIEAALSATGGNRTLAAKLLELPLRTLMDKIKRHGISAWAGNRPKGNPAEPRQLRGHQGSSSGPTIAEQQDDPDPEGHRE